MIQELTSEDQPSLVKVLKEYENDLSATAHSLKSTPLATPAPEEKKSGGSVSSAGYAHSVCSAESEGSHLQYLHGISQLRFQMHDDASEEARSKRIAELLNEMDSSYQNLKALAGNAKARATELDSVIKRTEARISSVISIAESRSRVQRDKTWAVQSVGQMSRDGQEPSSSTGAPQQPALGPQLGGSMVHSTPQGASSLSSSFAAQSSCPSSTPSQLPDVHQKSGQRSMQLPHGPSPIAPSSRRYLDESFEESLKETSLQLDYKTESKAGDVQVLNDSTAPQALEGQEAQHPASDTERSPLLSPTTQTKHELLERMSSGSEAVNPAKRREAVDISFPHEKPRSAFRLCFQVVLALILYALMAFGGLIGAQIMTGTKIESASERLEKIRQRLSAGVTLLQHSDLAQQVNTTTIKHCGLTMKNAGMELAMDSYLILADALGSCSPGLHERLFGRQQLKELLFEYDEDQLDSWGMLF